jgi:hypothetical protein
MLALLKEVQPEKRVLHRLALQLDHLLLQPVLA